MNTTQIIETIRKQMDDATPILERIIYLRPVPTRQTYGMGNQAMASTRYDKISVDKIESEINQWQYTTKTVLATCFGADSNHYQMFEHTCLAQRVYMDAKNELEHEVKAGRESLSSIIAAESIKTQLASLNVSEKTESRQPKIFISHKQEDKAYADAIVNLINFIIGADGDKIFCSSVPGYGIKQSRDIMDELRSQFEKNEIMMVIIHSPRYYQSAICLNEMGAAWVLGSQFASFMTKDCGYDDLRGVIGKESICININDDGPTLNTHFNDFKNDIVKFFGTANPDENKWENARLRFLNEVQSIHCPSRVDNDEVHVTKDLFKELYFPVFGHIFDLLDLEHFASWGYACGIAGNTVLRKDIYDNLDDVVGYIKSRPKNTNYASWDSLLRNLGQLVADFEFVFSQHAVQFGDDAYYPERFYKRLPVNPNYNEDLEAYNQHVMLVSDMIFELARLCNLILSRTREIFPEYRQDIGILYLERDPSKPDLMYRDGEISDAPYPGLKRYICERLSRETHLGSNPNIDANGYEAKH